LPLALVVPGSVRDLRSPVLEAVERVVGRDLDELLARELEELRVAGGGEKRQEKGGESATGHRDHRRLLPDRLLVRRAGA